jgi:hypothetical protein
LHVAWVAPGEPGRLRDGVKHLLASVGGAAHRQAL